MALQAQKQRISQFQLSKITLNNLNSFDVSPTTKLVLLSLVDCFNPDKPDIFPKQKTIADKIGISIKSVERAIKDLAGAGLIIYETKNTNRYKMTSKFFETLKMSDSFRQFVGLQTDNLSGTCKQINKHKNKQEFFKNNFSNDARTNWNRKTTFQVIKTGQELNYNYETILNKNSIQKALELSKTDTVVYYDEVLKLSAPDKEKLAKIKLSRTNLTDFQRLNLDKIIMLSEYEINKVNSLEPYFKQENIDIYYKNRVRKIKEIKEKELNNA